MYCSSCGSTVMPGLSYCSRCGVQLNAKWRPENSESPEVPSEYLIWAILAVSVGGLGVILALMAVMKQALNFGTELIVAFSLLSFLLIVAAESVFIWKLVSSRSRSKEADEIRRLREHSSKEVGEVPAGVLGEGAPTVTEHTTRELEPASKIIE